MRTRVAALAALTAAGLVLGSTPAYADPMPPIKPAGDPISNLLSGLLGGGANQGKDLLGGLLGGGANPGKDVLGGLGAPGDAVGGLAGVPNLGKDPLGGVTGAPNLGKDPLGGVTGAANQGKDLLGGVTGAAEQGKNLLGDTAEQLPAQAPTGK